MSQIRNIGIFAHVDAGKTTLSEQILSHAGAIRTIGSVDSGTAHTDNLPVERRRGISVKATCVSMSFGDTRINLIDTPGHADFSAEVERSMWALDGAVLVVCAVEGVQPQTEVLFEAMVKQNIPVLFFINKTDRESADVPRVMAQIKRLLTPDAVLLSDVVSVSELVCDNHDDLMERYINGEQLSQELLTEKLAELTQTRHAYPVMCGSALTGDGVSELLNSIITYLPPPKEQDELCGVVFAAMQDKNLGRGAWVRLYGGSLANREAVTVDAGTDPMTGETKRVQYKITQIQNANLNTAGKLSAGEIGVVYGLGNVQIGQVLGNPEYLERKIEPGALRTPLITVQVIPMNPKQMEELRCACELLSSEDPLLEVQYIRTLNELHLRVMGTIQLEIIEELLKTRFNLNVSFDTPAIIYKETVSEKCEGFVAYTMPKPCWAVLRFEIEPAPRGSGVTFSSTVPLSKIMACYQHQVEQAIPYALNQGRLGWQVTDVNIKLVDGEHHLVHTHPLDFIVATPMGIQDGLQRGGSTLLEPILAARFILPGEHMGRVMSDVIAMRGEVLDSVYDGDRVILNALVPVQSSMDYSITLATFTSGRGSMSVKLHGYRECPLELGSTAKRRGIDPLDTSKYILAVRGALTGDLFNLD
ncbi:MAG: TetM/TetW/TetO/TetS family tetracycline resistance ribosomal protection protein [Ruminococcaceae bacterium]|nr:TetM/TetW/TetO/TetS family tetracycline resistance ribosomal protection protein [Oscillospiraceae bacterium]